MRKLGVLVLLILAISRPSRADEMREFLLSCTYGVLAGTLVGTAMLAFTDKPGDNLNKIARGASIGLYAGILLGVYLVYGVSSEEEEPEGTINPEEGLPQAPPGQVQPPPDARVHKRNFPLISIAPLFNPNQKLDGAIAQVQVLRF